MNTKLVSISNHLFKTLAAGFSELALAALLVTAGGSSQAATSTTIRYNGTDFEGRQSLQLEWTALYNATYLVQSATDLAAADAWQTVDLVTPTNDAGQYEIKASSLPESSSAFFRLVLPQPQIISVEPAVVAPGVPVDLYVLGQCFDTNGVLQINGVTQAGAVVVSSSEATVPAFTPDVAGTYQVSLVVSGVVVSSFNVVCADALANPELVLQGPPATPPASPQVSSLLGIWLSKRGYDYWKAKGDLSAAGLQNNPYFKNNEMSGNMPEMAGKKDFKGHVTLMKAFDDGSGDSAKHTKTGHVTLMKAFDDDSGDSAKHTKTGHVTLMKAFDDGSDDIQEGKKGINAVNVKLARMAGVMPFSGEVQECDVDMVIPGLDLDFVWARTYHSRIGRFGSATNGWTFSYDVRCAQNSSGGLDVYDGTGRKDTFTLGTNGVYTCPEFFREGTLSNNTFTLTFADTGRWVFNPFDGSPTAGLVHLVITRNGSVMTLSHNATSGRLTQIVDDLGRTNTVDYDTGGRVASVTDFTGRSVTYQYYQGLKGDLGGAGDLKSVTSPPVTGTPNGNDFPDGKTTTYTYSTSFPADRENHLLLTVTEPKGQTAAVFTYEHSSTSANYLRCIAAQEGTNPAACYSYSAFRGTPHVPVLPASWCIVNDPVGNVTQYYFDARNRCLIEDDYTGRATPGLPVTDTLNRPTGQLRSTDPAYYETTWSWNHDSLCTAEISPGGQQVRCVYQSDFDPSTTARKRADCRVVREIAPSAVDLDGDGVVDVTDRSWHFDYDPRFGSDPSSIGFLRESPTKQSLRESPSKASLRLRESPTLSHLRESPTKQSLDIRESPTEPNRGGSLALLVPVGNSMAINTKGTGADKNRTAGGPRLKGWDGTVKGCLIVPAGNGVAIKTKGTGADPNRVAFEDMWPCDGDLDFNDQSVAYNFAVSATDPRGDVSTANFDAQGNPASVSGGGGGVGKITFNPFSITRKIDCAYDTHGQRIAITNAPDANGRRSVDTFTWSQGQLVQCVEDAGAGGLALTTVFEYDARGNLTRCIDPRTNDWLFTYNALDECVQSQSALLGGGGTGGSWRVTSQYAYDDNDNFVQCATELRDASGSLLGSRTDNYRYDGLDRLTEIALAVDPSHVLTNRYVYDSNDQCVQALGPDAVSGADPHQMVAYEYDERRLLFRAITAPGSALTATNGFDYNPNCKIKRFNCELYVETMAFDGFDRPSSVIDPMGNQTVCFYDANDNPKVVRLFGELNDVPGSAGNVRLAESRCEYDALDRRVRTHDLFFNPATQSSLGSGDAVCTCIYAPNDECVSVTDSLGRTTSFAYDSACRLSSVTDARGHLSVGVLDALGNVTAVTRTELPDVAGAPQVFSCSYAYDNFNRCVSSSDNVGNTSTCAYDSLDRIVRETNPNGNDSTYAYDLLDNCVASTDYADSSLASGGKPPTIVRSNSAAYDTSSRCLTSTDPNGNTTSYAYDSLGDCTTITEADGTQHSFVWDSIGDLIVEQDANGTTITNTYDLSRNLIHRDLAARGAAVATTTFENFAYDGGSRLVLAVNDVSSLGFSYDSLGDCTGSSQDGLAQSATYDSEGNQLSLTYPSGRVVTYGYDALNQVTNISTSAGGVSHPQLARFAYAGPGRLARIDRDNGINTRVDWDGFTNPGNSAGDYGWQEVSRVRDGSVASPSLVCDVTGSYSRTQSKLTRANAGRSSLTLTYDALEQLVESSDSVAARDTIYALDDAGNRQHVITNGTTMLPDYAMNSALPPGDFFMNRYTTTPFGSQQYDANGNLIVRASAVSPTFYHYDYADRLVEVDALSTLGTLDPVATFTYDALGNRISKTTYPGVPAAPVTTQYIRGKREQCDDGNILEERVGTSVSRAYCDMTTDGGSWTMAAFTATGAPQYYHCDELGNVLAVTDAGGNVLERYAYDDYGQPQFLMPDDSPILGSDGQPVTASPLGNPFLFHGLEWDGESALLGDGGGNYFDPPTGRAVRGKVKSVKDMGTNGRAVDGNNPWSGGGGGGGTEMKNGTVKFFNDAKGFGMVVGGGSKTHTKTGHVTLMK